jgi:hypothetical protein
VGSFRTVSHTLLQHARSPSTRGCPPIAPVMTYVGRPNSALCAADPRRCGMSTSHLSQNDNCATKGTPLHQVREAPAVVGAIRDVGPVLALTVGYVLLGVLLGHPPDSSTILRVSLLANLPLAFAAAIVLAQFIIFRRKAWRDGKHTVNTRPRVVWSDFRLEHLTNRRLVVFLLVFVSFPLLVSQYLAFKTGMVEYAPFSWDVRFMELDRVLHFGHHPWELIHPIVGYPVITRALDGLYWLWFPLKAIVAIWLACTANTRLRLQALLTWALILAILGNGFAALFSSAGPVYFSRVTVEPDVYEPLFAYLLSVSSDPHLLALSFQNGLWAAHIGTADFIFTGISAMPSIHVALATLFALIGFRIHKVLGAILVTFAIATLFGSVHLGWHYAVDGYVSLALVFILWVITGRFTEWYCGVTTDRSDVREAIDPGTHIPVHGNG